ncbi:hypothetical protein P5673_004307 [Acropora cervicornis]|uniref:Uncharacterized protein n=1 Tax=Acropora cervicornis TaxID=6130 RepID=A0AAD9R0G5_ACRCE|nr:hypothetical protein P5673_004307 [Acropora cervicornis]
MPFACLKDGQHVKNLHYPNTGLMLAYRGMGRSDHDYVLREYGLELAFVNGDQNFKRECNYQ